MGIKAVYGSPPHPYATAGRRAASCHPGQDQAEPLPEMTHLTFSSSTKTALPGPSAPLSL